MWILIALVILAALAVGVLSRGRKIGLSLVLVALAVALIWWDNFSTLELWIFWILFIVGLIITSRGSYRRGSRAGVGLVVLVITALLATNLNAFDGVKNALGSTVAALTAPQREAEIKAFSDDVKKEYDSAVAAIDAKNKEQDKRLTALESSDATQNKRLDALEAKNKEQDEALADLTKKVKGTVTTPLPTDLNEDQIAKAVTADLVDQGIKPNDVTFFTINWDENIYDVGNNPFADRMIDSQAKLKAHLNGSSDKGKANRAHVLAALPTVEERRALRAEGYVPMQFHTQSCLEGNTYYDVNKKKAIRDGIRCHKAGDVIWVYVGSDGKVYWDASVRADCGNGGMSMPPRKTHDRPKKPHTPRTPGTPGTPSTGTPTSSPSCTPNHRGEYCKEKDKAPRPSGQATRPGGTSTASASASPTHSGPTLTSGSSSSSTTSSSDGHTADASVPVVIPTTSTATGSPNAG